jgi:hypothetical protein
MPLRTTSSPILPPRKSGVSISDLLERLRRKDPLTAEVITGLAGEVNYIGRALREAPPSLTDVVVTDPNGKPITRIGSWVDNGVLRSGFWASEFYQGGEDADTAVIYSDENGQLVIGKNGSAAVLDPFGASAAWLGTQWDTLPVTGAADNGSGLIRLTVAAHGLITGDEVLVDAVGGVPNATGIWLVTVIDPNTIDLQGSGFGGAYTSGGWVSRVLHVSGAADNGSGLIRLTVTSHGYESGDRVNVQNVGGVPAASGQWTVTVVDANTLDLEGSAFAGAYTSGGTCVRYFAGGLFQNIAIGESFDNYALRAFPDGTLRIRNAEIVLTGTGGGIITLDPDVPEIVVEGVGSRILVDGTQYAVQIDGQSISGDAGISLFSKSTPSRDFSLSRRGATIIGEMFGGTTFELLTDNWAGAVFPEWFNYSHLTLTRNFWDGANVVLDGACEIDIGSTPHISIDDFTYGGSTTYSYVEAGRLRARDSVIVNGSTVIDSSRNATLAGLFLDSSTSAAEMLRISRTSTGHGLRLLNYSGITSSFELQRSVDLASWFGFLLFNPAAGRVGIGVTPNYTLDVAGVVNSSTAYWVNGARVVGPRAGTAPTKTARAAGASYTANEQAMLNELKAWQDAVDARINSTTGHGLWP